jgi:hypothetical protein
LHDSSYDWMLIDTSNLKELANTLDTVAIVCVRPETNFVYIPDTLTIDTFRHISVDFEYLTFYLNVDNVPDTYFVTDTCRGRDTMIIMESFKSYNHTFSYWGGKIDSTDTLLDKFQSNYEELPDLYGTGWHYKGWIMSPYLPKCEDLEKLTKPSWSEYIIYELFKGYDTCSIISTGTFRSFEHADDGNPYSDTQRVPHFPGEDFLFNLPCGAKDSLYFADQAHPLTSVGEIFVTLEPDNYNAATNFPLILLSTGWHIPNYRAVSSREANSVQNFLLANRSGRVTNNPFGFPGIRVALVRE